MIRQTNDAPSSSYAPPHVMYAQGLDGVPPSVQTIGLLPRADENAAKGGISLATPAVRFWRGMSIHGSGGCADVSGNGCTGQSRDKTSKFHQHSGFCESTQR